MSKLTAKQLRDYADEIITFHGNEEIKGEDMKIENMIILNKDGTVKESYLYISDITYEGLDLDLPFEEEKE